MLLKVGQHDGICTQYVCMYTLEYPVTRLDGVQSQVARRQ